MKTRKRILAGLMASLLLAGSFPHTAAAENSPSADVPLSVISAKDVGNLETLLSGAYLSSYQIPVSSFECAGGEYVDEFGVKRELRYAFDNDWMSFWQAADKTQVSSITVTFDEVSPVSRILYGLGERGNYGNGYPTKLKIAISRSDSGEDFVEVAAGSTEMTKDKVLFTLEEPVEAKRIKFIFEETYDSYTVPNPNYGGFATAAELRFLKSDPLFETVNDFFEDENSKQLKEKYQDDELLENLETQAEEHIARNYLVTKIRLAKQLVTGEVSPEDALDFPVEVIQKTGPDSENYVMLFVPDRFTIDQQDDFIEKMKAQIQEVMEYLDPFGRFTDKINMYALRIPSNETLATGQQRSYVADSYFKTYLDSTGYDIGTDVLALGMERIYDLVDQMEEHYLDPGGEVSVLHLFMNSDIYAGRGIFDPNIRISMATNHSYYLMAHEFCHAVGVLGEEYQSYHTTKASNVTDNSNPAEAPWKEFLGFRYVTHSWLQGNLYKASSTCLMDRELHLCEHCKLLIADKINEKLADKKELYIAKPIAYVDFYEGNGTGSITCGKEVSENNITAGNNKAIQYRTVVKSYAETDKNLTLKMYITGSDGVRKYEKSENFTVAPSEIKSLQVVSEIQTNLQVGDSISGCLVDTDTDTVLMDGDTYLNKYGTVTIKYRIGDGTQQTETALPNVSDCVLRLEADSLHELKPIGINGYEYTGRSIEASSVQVRENENIEVTYYYTKDKGKVTLRLTEEDSDTVKEIHRYIGRGEAFTPSQSDFPAKQGHRLVLPESAVFDGVNDIVLAYSYEEGEPEPDPVMPEIPQISQEDIITEEVTQGGSIDLTDNIRNLPSDATVTVLQNVSSDTSGNFTGRVKITFANDTFREVDIPVIVRAAAPVEPDPTEPEPTEPEATEPEATEPEAPEISSGDIITEEVTQGGNIDLTDNIRNLPSDARVTVLRNVSSDTAGTFTGKVKVIFGNGTFREVDIPVIIRAEAPAEPDPVNPNPVVLPFTDIEAVEGNWKFESIKYVYSNDIMQGISGTKLFQPDNPLTRAMFATVLYRLAGSPSIAYAETFQDVSDGKWYSQAVIWANREGIVNGFSDGSYGININITREQMAKMLFEFAKKQKYNISKGSYSDNNILEKFTDSAEISGWATNYMQWAVAVEMISGKPNGDGTYRLDPKGEATRAECAAMLARFEKNKNSSSFTEK